MATDSRRMTGVAGLVAVLQGVTVGDYFNDFSATGVVKEGRETRDFQAIQIGTRLRVRDGSSARQPKRNSGHRMLRLSLIIEVHVKRIDADSLGVEMRQTLHDIELVIDKNLAASGACSEVINTQIPAPVYDYTNAVATTEVTVTVEAQIVEGSTT